MKSFTILSVIMLVLVSCDPMQLVYVRNYSENVLLVRVNFQKQAPDFQSFNIHMSDTIVENTKALLKHNFGKSIPVQIIGDSCYYAKLPSTSTSLLSPLTIGFPIEKVFFKGENSVDSVFFRTTKNQMKLKLAEAKLQKVNWAFYIYDFGK
jgi:hypothetical protein